MPSIHLILCRPLLLLPPIPPSIRVFSNESTLRMRWPKYWSFSFSIIPSKEHPGLISFRMDWLDLLAVQGVSRVFSNTTVQKHQFFGAQPSSQSNSHILVPKKHWRKASCRHCRNGAETQEVCGPGLWDEILTGVSGQGVGQDATGWQQHCNLGWKGAFSHLMREETGPAIDFSKISQQLGNLKGSCS